MKNNLLSCLAILLSFSALAQVPNSGFENWTSTTLFSQPDVSPANFTSVNSQFFFLETDLGVTQVATGVSGSAMHLETFDYDGDTMGGFAIFGSLPEDDTLIFSDGFPFTDVMVSGITMDIRYDINPQSPGFILVQFLANGTPVNGGPDNNGTYLFQVSGSQEDWTSMTFDFIPSLSQIPDECVIAFGCNDLIADSIAFPGDWLEVDNLQFEGTMMEDIPGGDFESWEDVTSESPDGWDTYLPPNLGFINPTSNSYSGDLAIELNTVVIEEEAQQSMIYQAQLNEQGITPNQPLVANSYALQFHYQFYSPDPDETAIVYLLLSEELDPAPEDMFFVSSTLMQTDGWIQSTIDFEEEMPEANYYGLIFFSGGGFDEDGIIGSQLLLDDVSFLTFSEECEFVPTINGGDEIACIGGDFELTTQVYDSYQWFAGLNGFNEFEFIDDSATLTSDDAIPGVYDVFLLATLDGCTASSDTITVTLVEGPIPTITEVGDMLETESGMDTYTWYYNGAIIGNTESVEIQGNGSYAVAVENSDGCDGQSEDYQVTGVGIEELDFDLAIYPNPAQDVLTIQLNNTSGGVLRIYNLLGEIVKYIALDESQIQTISLSELQVGSYMIAYVNQDILLTQNLIIQR